MTGWICSALCFLFFAVSLTAGEFAEDLARFNAALDRSWKKHQVTPAPAADDAVFFKRPLTPQEVRELYNAKGNWK